MRRLWNCALAIHKLPNELLLQIFEYFPHTSWTRRDEFGQFVWVELGWPGLMLVCHHWRNLLVSAPAFWREVNLRQQTDWTTLCLSRSAPYSIIVRAQDCPLEHLGDIQSHVHRLKEFHFSNDMSHFSLLPVLGPLFDGGMPLLETLQLTGRTTQWRGCPIRINLQITSDRFPSLQVLALQASGTIVVPQDLSLYAQLHKLELDGCFPQLSLDGFLNALAASTQLEELHLSWGVLADLPGAEWPQHVPYRTPVSLPRLRDFLLDEYRIDRISSFLAHLLLPPSAALFIQGRFSDETTNTVDAMLPPNRSTTLPALSLAANAHLTIQDGGYTIGCDDARSRIDIPENSQSPQATFKLAPGNPVSRFWNLNPGLGQGLDDLVHALGPSPLRRLCVDGTAGAVAAWERVFRAFPLLEDFTVVDRAYYRDARNVTSAFRGLHAASSTAHADPDSDSDSGTVACPNLREIRVEGTGTTEMFQAMRDCFQYRRDRGAILESLDVEGMVGWADVPSRLVRDISAAVKTIRTTTNDMSEWERGQHENDHLDRWPEG
ncbi:hypothetical protein GSI_03471 [Ganoderma sinense ZZ0214-1]|uniref:F-box domain-containing protein n=1 Tax=Ganoderma sinense ZZ0214-1 TaxID=1077348 RepID=A0A2G8SLQ4_9APHY|nr:hypothetical protein GSI_03471 [Ganoderma sinense ZZ0214-1]